MASPMGNIPSNSQPGLTQPSQASIAPQSQSPNQPKPLYAQVAGNLPFKESYYKTLQKGSLVNFSYFFWKHDPVPLLIVTDVFPDRIRGVNLHYLTYRYMKAILANYCGQQYFSFRYIAHDRFVVNAFRTYKRAGMVNIKMLDCPVINNVLNKVRSFNPQALDVIRQEIQQQLNAQMNPTAEQMAQQYQKEIITPQAELGFMPLEKERQQDGRRAFRFNPELEPPNPQSLPNQ